MRAKFVLTKIERVAPTQENLTLGAVCASSFGPNGESEDNDFARWTPSGSLSMTVNNPNLIGKFHEGQKFYLDFTPVPEPTPVPSQPPVDNAPAAAPTTT